MRSMLVIAVSAGTLAVFAAGCGGSGGKPAAAGGQSTAPGSPATVAVKKSKLGEMLVDAKGKSVYLFEKDKGTSSTCFDACAGTWPPYLTNGKPKAAGAASAGLIGTTKRKDGGTEVTFHGHPLYYYAGDKSPGDTKGQALKQFGAEWYVLSPKGDKIDNG